MGVDFLSRALLSPGLRRNCMDTAALKNMPLEKSKRVEKRHKANSNRIKHVPLSTLDEADGTVASPQTAKPPHPFHATESPRCEAIHATNKRHQVHGKPSSVSRAKRKRNTIPLFDLSLKGIGLTCRLPPLPSSCTATPSNNPNESSSPSFCGHSITRRFLAAHLELHASTSVSIATLLPRHPSGTTNPPPLLTNLSSSTTTTGASRPANGAAARKPSNVQASFMPSARFVDRQQRSGLGWMYTIRNVGGSGSRTTERFCTRCW